MALTVTEAMAVNRLLQWVLEPTGAGEPLADSAGARTAAALLADSAHKRLVAGLDAAAVAARWPAEVPF